MIAQKSYRLRYALSNSELRPPPKSPHGRAVQKDERIVSDPPTVAASVAKLRPQVQLFTNPSYGIVHLAILVCPKVQHRHASITTFDRGQDRVDAVLNVEIRFSLFSVAEH